MGRKSKIVTREDGTPIAVESTPEEVAEEAAEDAKLMAEISEYTPTPDPVAEPLHARRVVWTADGAAAGAFSEHGQHAAGDIVETLHADALIAAGYAEEAE